LSRLRRNVGRLVAKFAIGMDMKVLAYDIMPDKSFALSPDFRFASLQEVLT
jgi:phosphoglycerate dehydrogenase-like enzyme